MTLSRTRALDLHRQAIWRAADEALREESAKAQANMWLTSRALNQALGRGTITQAQWDAGMERMWERYAAEMAPAEAAYDRVADMLWPEERRRAREI